MYMDFPTLIISLFTDDWLFFNEDEIVWDGKHHKLAGIQVNGAQMDQLMDYVNQYTDFDDINEVVQFAVAFMNHIEQDEGLIVPRSMIASGLHKAIREGDLTGITLMNLTACARAFQVRATDENQYACIYDTRLSMGIPSFFDLIARFMWDMRSAMNSLNGVPFDIVFAGARNIDVDAFLGQVNKPVAGAQENPAALHVESEPAVKLQGR